jgi:hypothetical protein
MPYEGTMMATKKTESIAADEAELAALDRRIPEMNARDQDLLKIQIAQEATATASFEAAVDKAQALAMVAGHPFVATREKPISPLEATLAERKTLAGAIKIAGDRLSILTTERSARIWASYSAEIAAIEKRRMMLVFELQRTNRAREKLREKITKAGGAGFLSTDGVEFLGFGDEYAEIGWASKRLIADGIATSAEIEKARSDG